jgi:hypothetical protein
VCGGCSSGGSGRRSSGGGGVSSRRRSSFNVWCPLPASSSRFFKKYWLSAVALEWFMMTESSFLRGDDSCRVLVTKDFLSIVLENALAVAAERTRVLRAKFFNA